MTWTRCGKRLDKLVATVDSRREERKAQKAKQTDEARARQGGAGHRGRGAGAERAVAGAGERLRALVDTWKGLPRLDRKSDDELWHRFSHARSAFSKRRKAHFASLDAQREDARKAKEKLVAEAESLSGSTDWGPTAARYRELMAEWKAAGRAQREPEDDLWNRFRGAQDVFFAARSEVFAERDAEQAENLKLKEELADEAEKLLPVTDLKAARAAFRSLNERWEAIGHVPRDARPKVEGRMHAVERAMQEAEETEWRRTNPEARARAAGSDRSAPGGRGQAARADRRGARGGQQRQGRQARQGAGGPAGPAGPGAEGPGGVRRLTAPAAPTRRRLP